MKILDTFGNYGFAGDFFDKARSHRSDADPNKRKYLWISLIIVLTFIGKFFQSVRMLDQLHDSHLIIFDLFIILCAAVFTPVLAIVFKYEPIVFYVGFTLVAGYLGNMTRLLTSTSDIFGVLFTALYASLFILWDYLTQHKELVAKLKQQEEIEAAKAEEEQRRIESEQRELEYKKQRQIEKMEDAKMFAKILMQEQTISNAQPVDASVVNDMNDAINAQVVDVQIETETAETLPNADASTKILEGNSEPFQAPIDIKLPDTQALVEEEKKVKIELEQKNTLS